MPVSGALTARCAHVTYVIRVTHNLTQRPSGFPTLDREHVKVREVRAKVETHLKRHSLGNARRSSDEMSVQNVRARDYALLHGSIRAPRCLPHKGMRSFA